MDSDTLALLLQKNLHPKGSSLGCFQGPSFGDIMFKLPTIPVRLEGRPKIPAVSTFMMTFFSPSST